MTNPAEQPRVEIIVLNWNRKEDTLECLQSLNKTDYNNYGVTVVDNASDDGTPAAVADRFPGHKLIVNDGNLRFAAGNNVGIDSALETGAEYILLLNNDTVVGEGFLAPLVEALAEDETAGIAGSKIYYYDTKDLIWHAGGKVNLATGNIYHVGLRRADSAEFSQPAEVDYVSGCCMLIKRRLLEDIGGLDERYYIYSEDVDFCFRAREAGSRTLYEPRSKIWHKISASSGGELTPFKAYHRMKSNMRFFRIHAATYHWLSIPFFVSLRAASYLVGTIIRGDVRGASALVRGGLNFFSAGDSEPVSKGR